MAQAGAAIGPAQARVARGRSVLVKAGLSAVVRHRSVAAAAKPPTGAVRNGANSAASASSVRPAKAARPG